MFRKKQYTADWKGVSDMKNFDNMIEGLREDTKVPEEVWKRYTATLANLPEKEGKREPGKRNWIKYTAAAAAAAVTVTTVCFANPAFAAKIPILGEIFKQVQHQSTFSGDYSDKAEVLSREEADGTIPADSGYTVQDAGVTITASEIYCDGLSVFVTAEVDVEQGGLNNIPGNILYLEGDWKLSDSAEEIRLMNNNLEGNIVDDNTFVGMLKLDLEEQDLQAGTLELQLSMVGYDDINETDAEDISAFHKIQGAWSLELPFEVDTEAVKEIPVNKEENGYSLNKVFVSPYQVITYTDAPYTEREITREEYESVMREKTGGSDDFGITYEEFAEQMGRTYEQCQTIIFNQEGERLTPTAEFYGKSVNAVRGMDISELKIYVFDDMDLWVQAAEEGADSEALNQAVLSADIDVESLR